MSRKQSVTATSTECPRKMYRDLVGSRVENLALLNGLSISNCSSIIYLNIDASFVDIFALRVAVERSNFYPAPSQSFGLMASANS